MNKEIETLPVAMRDTLPTTGGTVRYIIETTGGGNFTVKAFVSGFLSALGHNPTIATSDFSGQVLLNTESIEESSLHLIINAASLAVVDDISKRDSQEINRKMHDEVLESESFPKIVYECSHLTASKVGEGQYWVALRGDLTLHGVTRTQPVAGRVLLHGDMLRVTGDFSVLQSDYQIKPVSAVGGTLKLKDELKLSFSVSARRQD